MATDTSTRRPPIRASAKRKITILPMPIVVTRRVGEPYTALDGATFVIHPTGALVVTAPWTETDPSLTVFAPGEWRTITGPAEAQRTA